jgi:hypothetical protein
VFDPQRDLYGTTLLGGPTHSDGTVFKVVHDSNTVRTITSFDGQNGVEPDGLVLDSRGDIFGTTELSGPSGTVCYGEVFEVVKGSSTVTPIVAFDGTDGDNLTGALVDSGRRRAQRSHC